eukprot:SAG22_NODE_363_length_11694_cov_40.815783_9_plen_129_part_00
MELLWGQALVEPGRGAAAGASAGDAGAPPPLAVEGQGQVRVPHRAFDVICGGDILLFTAAHSDLLATLRMLSSESTVVLIEHTDRSNMTTAFPEDLKHFLALVADDGLWRPTIVRDVGRHITVRMVRE